MVVGEWEVQCYNVMFMLCDVSRKKGRTNGSEREWILTVGEEPKGKVGRERA